MASAMPATGVAASSTTAAINVCVRETSCGSSSSNAAFGSNAVRFAPVARRSGGGVKVDAATAVRASASTSSSEEPKAGSARQAMVGLLAAGAILVSGVPAFALTGPGGDGAAATTKGADVLLKKADKLTKDDSPARFGTGLKNAGSTATQAGSATASNVQDVADAAVTKARENLSKAKASFGNVIVAKDKKTSSASSAAGDAERFVSGLGDKVKRGGGNAGDVASGVKSKAGSAIADAKSKLPNPVPKSLPQKKAGQKF